MQSERLQELYKRYQSGQLKPEELQQWRDALADLSHDAEFLALIDPDWAGQDLQPLELDAREQEAIYQYIIAHPQKLRQVHGVPLWKRWGVVSAVAAAVALMILGVYFFNSYQTNIPAGTELAAQDVAPGQTGATLTLASGKKIRLSDAASGKLAEETGIAISKTADGQLVYEVKGSDTNPDQINTLSTAKGETYVLTLPDKSKVWLNAASSLTYAAGLNERGLRRVRLEGEAYFQVAKDKLHPFVVESRGQLVKVLGTEFNVNSYADEPFVATTLVEGSVQLQAGDQAAVLAPGQQALNTTEGIKVAPADVETVTDWKSGDFFLNRVDFRTAMRKIARWYDVEVIFDASVPQGIKSSGYISRSRQLSAVLKSIEKAGQVRFRIEGKRLYVTKY
jgi:transmembrane sensor